VLHIPKFYGASAQLKGCRNLALVLKFANQLFVCLASDVFAAFDLSNDDEYAELLFILYLSIN
jgi:hypothetical protein